MYMKNTFDFSCIEYYENFFYYWNSLIEISIKNLITIIHYSQYMINLRKSMNQVFLFSLSFFTIIDH